MPRGQTSEVIAIIDDDESSCDSLRDLIESAGLEARCFGSAEEFLESGLHGRAGVPDHGHQDAEDVRVWTCRLGSKKRTGISRSSSLPPTEMPGVRMQAMREGAVEFLAKPFDHQLLLKTIRAALDR